MTAPKPEQFAAAVEQIKAKRTQLGAAIEVEILARNDLAETTAHHIRQGLQGKNQAERDAYLQVALVIEQSALNNAEEETRTTRLEHELAVLELDSLRYQLRAVEVAMKLEVPA